MHPAGSAHAACSRDRAAGNVPRWRLRERLPHGVRGSRSFAVAGRTASRSRRKPRSAALYRPRTAAVLARSVFTGNAIDWQPPAASTSCAPDSVRAAPPPRSRRASSRGCRRARRSHRHRRGSTRSRIGAMITGEALAWALRDRDAGRSERPAAWRSMLPCLPHHLDRSLRSPLRHLAHADQAVPAPAGRQQPGPREPHQERPIGLSQGRDEELAFALPSSRSRYTQLE